MPDVEPLWAPAPERVARSNLARFAAFAHATAGAPQTLVDGALDYDTLYQWSIAQPGQFWPAVWEFCGVIAEERAGHLPWDSVVVGLERMAPPDSQLGPRWFTGARFNFAENLLRFRDDRRAVVSWNESGRQQVLSYAELYTQVQLAAGALRAQGIGPGDRVAAFLPNIPEAIVAMLATASLGAIWSSCSPDFGASGVLDRFGQIAPRLLVACDGYRYAGKEIDTRGRVAAHRLFTASFMASSRIASR